MAKTATAKKSAKKPAKADKQVKKANKTIEAAVAPMKKAEKVTKQPAAVKTNAKGHSVPKKVAKKVTEVVKAKVVEAPVIGRQKKDEPAAVSAGGNKEANYVPPWEDVKPATGVSKANLISVQDLMKGMREAQSRPAVPSFMQKK